MTPEEKLISLIDILKEEWDLTPKQNSEPVMVQAGVLTYFRKANEIVISKSRLPALEKSCSIADDTQLQNILGILQQEGFISNFRFPEILSDILTIQLPEDFEKRYTSYRETLYNKAKITTKTNNSAPIIKSKTLELISQAIGNLGTGTELIDFLTECGVDGKLIEYPQTKWRMVYSVLINLATSPKIQDQEALFKIIEEAAHPLMHEGNEEAAKQYEVKFNNLLKYDNFIIQKGRLKKIEQQSKLEEDDENDEEDVFSYDGGLSSPYENTDLELFILKKIQLEHKRRDDSGFFAKEFSFNNNSLEEICRVMNKLMEDKILYLSANTRPERFENEEGIEDKSGFINWKIVEKLDKNPQKMDAENGCVIFDIEVLDEVKLKGRIDIAIEEFMNDKIYTPLGIMMDKAEVSKILASVGQEMDADKKSAVEEALKPKKISYPYYKQRAIMIDEISKDNKEELIIPLNNFRDEQVDMLKVVLGLEKENLLRITELRSNSVYDERSNFIGHWSAKDNPVARIYTLKTQTNKQEPLLVKLVAGSEIQVKREKQTSYLPKISNLLNADLKPEIIVGKLCFYNDGSIRYDGNMLEMRNQLKDLCRLFMNRIDVLTTVDQIRDEVISANKRKATSFNTISKYVSELHSILQIHFQKPVIFNQKEEGWYFRPPK